MLDSTRKPITSLEIYRSYISEEKQFTKWKDNSVSYGNRWIVETVFSSIKRTFAEEYVYSIKSKNMIQE